LSSFSVPLITDVREIVSSIDPAIQSRERFQIEQDLRQAVGRDELRMQFQPLIDASTGRVSGAEALLRWHHPTRGLIPPTRFIPIMEASDLSPEIGLWALNRAAREARQWRDGGHDLRVAVNVSGRQLDGADLPLLIERTLARHDLGGEALEIELTETVALAEGDCAARLSDALRSRGIRIAIDDFGTGYSSFAALNAIAFDKIKIDRAFVTDVHARRESQAICSSILTLGRGLGINVLAEGVETAEEFLWLRDHGCRFFQGFYFARPLSGEDFLTFVKDEQTLNKLLQPDTQLISERMRA
ncbi:MAG: EAL domain-containing protein, partial [Pseudomonadota bacterium]|nr:EAL domain-containing protein [Pseudomonadota bacterium]